MNVMKPDDVWVVSPPQDFNLIFQHLQSRGWKPTHLDNLHGILQPVFAHCPIDTATIPSSDLIGKPVSVVTHHHFIITVSAGRFHELGSGATLTKRLGRLLSAVRAWRRQKLIGWVVALIHIGIIIGSRDSHWRTQPTSSSRKLFEEEKEWVWLVNNV